MTAKRETAERRAMTIHVETGPDAGKMHEIAVGPIVVGRAFRLADRPLTSVGYVNPDLRLEIVDRIIPDEWHPDLK